MPDSFDYTTGTNSENVRLLQALIDDAPEYTEETNSRNANILKSIINNTEYTDAPQSEIEELLLRLKAKIGGEIEVDELNVTENGTYDAGVNKAYNPVKVELPLSSKTITENGTYTASDDNLAGFNEVTVAVQGYAKKSIANTPTPIATFNASALPMPSLSVGIEAVQSGTGDPSPTNIRPFTGWSAVNATKSGVNLYDWKTARYMKGADKLKQGQTIYIRTNGETKYGKIYIRYVGDALATEYPVQVDVTESITLTKDVYVIALTEQDVAKLISENKEFTISLTPIDDVVPYSGTTYTTTLKDGQGNPLVCYGGTLSNENGVQTLTDDFVFYTFTGNESGSAYSGGGFYLTTGIPVPITRLDGMCDIATMISTADNLANNQGVVANGSAGVGAIAFKFENVTTLAEFKTLIAGHTIRLKRSTPQQIPQDSLAIATQEGVNNLWADSGDIQSGEYLEAL